LQTRIEDKQGEPMKQVLVQWEDDAVEVATWEDVTNIQEQFPEFHLEDKADSSKVIIVRPLETNT